MIEAIIINDFLEVSCFIDRRIVLHLAISYLYVYYDCSVCDNCCFSLFIRMTCRAVKKF